MPVKKSKKFAVIQRREQVASLLLQGWPQTRIAEHVGVSQSQICQDLKKIHQDWRESAVRDFDLAREIELRRIDHINTEAAEAWDKSKKPSQSAVVTGEGGSDQKVRKTMKNQHGNPRYLEIMLKCVATRRAMLGLDAPMQITPVMPDGSEPYRVEVDQLSYEDLRVLKRLRLKNQEAPIIEGKLVDQRNGND